MIKFRRVRWSRAAAKRFEGTCVIVAICTTLTVLVCLMILDAVISL